MIADDEARVLEVVREFGTLEAYRRLIAENDALIRGAELGNGSAIATARTAIHTTPIADWAQQQKETLGYRRPFAVVALGGTGREEMTPRSDLDIGLLFDDALEGNEFLLELQRQTIHSDEFARAHGFSITPLPFSFDDVPRLAGKDLNSFLDARPLYDPDNLAAAFRSRIRASFDPFEHFLYVRGFWKKQLADAPPCERMDRFDIKSEALRIFQAGIWTLASHGFQHSHDIYRALVDERDLAAYHFLLRIRSWVHLRRSPERPTATGHHAEDVLAFDDFTSFGEMLGPDAGEAERSEFGNEVRARLLSARRRVAAFARGVIERELREGRRVATESPVVFGPAGLRHTGSQNARTPQARSRAALSLVLAAQRYGVPVDPSELQATFHNAGDWMEHVPEVASLFYETHGSLADTFAFLGQIDGLEERLFPGRARFEASLDERVLQERRELRAAFELRKLRTLERFIAQGSPSAQESGPDSPISAGALLDPDHLAAVKLALKTKRLPVTPDDEAARNSSTLPLHERFASGFSGIALADYFQRLGPACGFSAETLAATEFLIANRRAFKTNTLGGQNDIESVTAFRTLCGNEQRLHALFLFTCADRAEWEGELAVPSRWFLIRELYLKTLHAFRDTTADAASSLTGEGYAPEDLRVLRDFGDDFFAGLYSRHANRFGSDLLRLVEESDGNANPKAALLHEGASLILGVAARDFQGLAACISGAFWKERIAIGQAHFFSATNHGLALDFFHLAPGCTVPTGLPRIVEESVRARGHLSGSDEGALPRLADRVELDESRPGQFRLRCEAVRDTGELIYALCLKTLRHLRGNIHSLNASTTRNGAFITIRHTLPASVSLDEARRVIRESF